MEKANTLSRQIPWFRLTSDFTYLIENPPEGGSSKVIQFFEENKTKTKWIGKCNSLTAFVPSWQFQEPVPLIGKSFQTFPALCP